MEKIMRQIHVAVLLTLTVVSLTPRLNLAQSTLKPVDLSIDSQEMRLANNSTLPQRPFGTSLVMAQSTAQKQSVMNGTNSTKQTAKSNPNQIQTPTSDSMDHYQCMEHCAVVRQSCEGLATIQPDTQIATIGSE